MRLGVEAALVDGELVAGDLEVVGDRVARVGLPGNGRGIAIPGLVDLQVNGFAGVDFASADRAGYELARDRLVAAGTTAFQPTLVTASEGELVAALGALSLARDPCFLGVHLEGPFLSPARLGAHLPEHRRDPDGALLDRLLDAGTVSQMTLAPELPGALELIEQLCERGVVVSLGHSDATSAQAARGFTQGARTITHLFNAMRPFAPRDPGLAFAALARDGVFVTLIADGHHLADDTVRVAAGAAGARLVLITDAVAAAAAPDGEYTLGGSVPLRSKGGVVRDARGALAGSALSMPAAVRNLHALGVPLAVALGAATATPARMAGRPDLGRLAPGTAADLVVLDDTLAVDLVLVAGTEAFCR
jgi:N-acetylglucosamine-6-phosphate deacetylase